MTAADEPIVLPADPDLPVPYTVADVAGKDGRQAASTLPPEVLDLLAAIRDHVDVPLPGTDDADELAWHVLMIQRLSTLHASLDVALSPTWIATTNAAHEAAYIRKRTAATPVTYALYEQDGGEQS